MSEKLRFAEAVCAGHPDRLADTIAERIVALAVARDPDALVGVEVALHRNVVFVDGRVAAGREAPPSRRARSWPSRGRPSPTRATGTTPSGVFRPEPGRTRRADRPLPRPAARGRARDPRRERRPVDLRRPRRLGAPRGPPSRSSRPSRPDFASALERLRVERPDLGLGPDGKTLVVVRGRALVGVSLSVHHAPGIDWVALTREARAACESVAGEIRPVGARAARAGSGLARQRRGGLRGGRPRGRQRPLGQEARGPGLRLRRADRRGSDPRQGPAQGRPAGPGPGASTRSRQGLPGIGAGGHRVARLPPRATSPPAGSRWSTLPDDEHTEEAKFNYWQSASDAYRENMKRGSKRRS